ncbi:bone morphogenetic 1-like, partial [Paramuricea clavata]
SCQSTPTLQSKNGTIKGPGYPDRYPNNAASCWRIYVPENNVIKLIIHRLDLESCSGCACDSVEVFDGYSESSRSLGKFCSGNRILTSSGRNLFVKFTSDRSVNGDAFTASYYKEAK